MEFAHETRQLCHGISFSEHEPDPMLRLRRAEHWHTEYLAPGRQLSLAIGELKHCLGHVRMNPDGSRQNLPCPKSKALRTGTQCESCRRRDQTKFMHHFHKTGEAPEGLRKYLEQPHFLYIAGFANGATKVGTASTQSKFSRLAQQGAVSARYIARAADGAAIRVLEDLLTEHVGLSQQVRQKAKARGLSSWELDYAGLEELTAAAAQRARDFLSAQRGLAGYGIELRDEPWVQPAFARPVIEAWDARRLHAWNAPLPGSTVNLRIRGVLGQSILADSGDGSTLRLLDAAELKTREVVIADRPAELFEEHPALF